MLSRQRHSPMALSLLLLLIGLLDHGTSVAQARPTQIPLLITENSFDPLQRWLVLYKPDFKQLTERNHRPFGHLTLLES